MLSGFRSGTWVQSALSSASISVFPARPLRSMIVTRFSATMGLSDSRPMPAHGYVFPPASLRVPHPPRKAQWRTAPVASPPVAGFALIGGLAVFPSASRGRIGSLSLRLAGSLSSRDTIFPALNFSHVLTLMLGVIGHFARPQGYSVVEEHDSNLASSL
jgi:hypothetical protein